MHCEKKILTILITITILTTITTTKQTSPLEVFIVPGTRRSDEDFALMGLAWDGRYLWVVNGTGFLYCLDTSIGITLTQMPAKYVINVDAKVTHVADLDGDGRNELIVGTYKINGHNYVKLYRYEDGYRERSYFSVV